MDRPKLVATPALQNWFIAVARWSSHEIRDGCLADQVDVPLAVNAEKAKKATL